MQNIKLVYKNFSYIFRDCVSAYIYIYKLRKKITKLYDKLTMKMTKVYDKLTKRRTKVYDKVILIRASAVAIRLFQNYGTTTLCACN